MKSAAFRQHPRPSYFDREPDGQPKVMGYSVRTDGVRYTEWRNWKSGEVAARELYDAREDSAEMRNAIGAPSLTEAQRAAESLRRKQFPINTR